MIQQVLETAQYPAYIVACIFLARWYIRANEKLLESQDNTLALVREELKNCQSERLALTARVAVLEKEAIRRNS